MDNRFYLLFLFCFVLKTGSLYPALTVLELTMCIQVGQELRDLPVSIS